jgi:predicted permease
MSKVEATICRRFPSYSSEVIAHMPSLLNLFRWRRNRLERDLDRELKYHVERRIDDLTATGLTKAEARRQASLELGGVPQVQESVRDTWVWRWLDDCRRDIRHAVRTLGRTPTFTLTAALSLALGIGANTAIVSMVDQVLLRQLPVKDPQQIVLIDWRGNQLADGWGSGNLMSYPMCRDLQAQVQFFDGVFCRHPTLVNFSAGRDHQPVLAEIVSGTYFTVLGVRPHLGRLIAESDDVQRDAHPVVVISHAYWASSLGSPADIVGRKVLLNNQPMTVIGVAEPGFNGMDVGEAAVLWVPAMMKRQATPGWDRLLDRRARWMHVFGRLKPGVTAASSMAGLQPWFKLVLQSDMTLESFPKTTPEQLRAFLGSYLDVTPASHGRSNMRRAMAGPLWVLMGGTALLVLLACSNVASLLLARGAARGREVVTRIALGASRGRIANQLLIESMVISLAGGLLGILAAPAVSAALLSFLPQDAARTSLTTDLNLRVLLFALFVSLATGALCGMAPALHAGRLPLVTALRDRAPSGGGVRLRRALVIGQMAFTLIMLIAAGLFLKTVSSLYAKGPGFATDGLLMFQIDAARSGYEGPAAPELILRLLTVLRESPGVESAALSGHPLLGGGSWNNHLTIDRNGRVTTDRLVHINPISPRFFSTLGTRLIAGRDFDERDARDPRSTELAFRSAIVNASFARRYFGDESPVGRRIGFGTRPDTQTNVEIVGVVSDFSYRGIQEETDQAFLAFFELPWGGATFYAKVQGKPENAFASIRTAVAGVDPTLPLLSLRTLESQVDRSLGPPRMMATLLSGFGAVALLLSVIGLYGVMSFVVTHRTREIGIRLALGATRRTAVWLVVRDALVMIGCGTAIALLGGWALTRVVAGQILSVAPIHAPTIALAALLLAVVTLGAAMVPAWRASSVSPTEALHAE